jgi:hypothetical protein
MSEKILDNLIHIGNAVNDGLGDDLRTAFRKVNENFTELSGVLTITAENVGSGKRVFKRKDGANLEFRTIISGGAGILVEEQEDTISITNNAPIGFTKITATGEVESRFERDITFDGKDNIDINIIGPRITFDTININGRSYKDILSSFDFGYVSGIFDNAVQFSVANTNADFGTVENPTELNFDLGGAQGPQRL